MLLRKTTPSRRILIVEDDVCTRNILEYTFRSAGDHVETVPNGEEAWKSIQEQEPNVVILDLNLPDMEGKELCQRIRNDSLRRSVAILMITGENSEGLPVSCLDAGADDFLTKPLDLTELLARVRAVLRRPRIFLSDDSVIKSGGITIFMAERRILGQEGYLRLTPKEFDLLVLLIAHSPKVLPRNILASRVWGTPLENLHNRTLDVHIRRIRRELGPAANCLKTLTAFGFQWIDESMVPSALTRRS